MAIFPFSALMFFHRPWLSVSPDIGVSLRIPRPCCELLLFSVSFVTLRRRSKEGLKLQISVVLMTWL